MSLRIAYFGLPLGAVVLLHAGVDLVSIALGHPDAIGGRRVRQRARGLLMGRPRLDDASVVRALASSKPDAILSWFWPKRIPANVLALAPRGAFGVHPSLLPRHRGGDPYFHSILQGDSETGVTLHRLDAEYDTGAIIDAITLAIRSTDDAWRLARRMDRPSLRLLLSAAERLGAGERLDGRAQDEALATMAEPPSEDDLAFDWDRDAPYLERLTRAAGPTPGAIAQLGDTLVAVLSARVITDAPRILDPGEAFFVEGRVHVRTGDGGALAIDHVRIEETEDEAGDPGWSARLAGPTQLCRVRSADDSGRDLRAGQELRGEEIARLVPRG